MNQVAFLQSIFARRFSNETPSERCDLTLLADFVLTSMSPVLDRRNQSVKFHPTKNAVVVRGDVKIVFALVSAVILEAAGLSSARANLRVAFDIDDGDAVVTIVGSNCNHFPRSYIRLDQQLADQARQGGAEVELIWNENGSPTLILRFPNAEAGFAP